MAEDSAERPAGAVQGAGVVEGGEASRSASLQVVQARQVAAGGEPKCLSFSPRLQCTLSNRKVRPHG